MQFKEGPLDDPRVADLVRTHLTRARAETATGSSHALDLSGLRAPDVTFWSAWEGDTLAGVGALRTFDTTHGAVKTCISRALPDAPPAGHAPPSCLIPRLPRPAPGIAAFPVPRPSLSSAAMTSHVPGP